MALIFVMAGILVTRDLLKVDINHTYTSITHHQDLMNAASTDDLASVIKLATTYGYHMQRFTGSHLDYSTSQSFPTPMIARTESVTAAHIVSSPTHSSLAQLAPYTHLIGLHLWVGCAVPTAQTSTLYVFYNKATL